MRIAVIGASGAGLPFAAFLLQKHPEWDVHLFDANPKIGRKLLATGNGHCNLLNKEAASGDYNSPDFVEEAFRNHSYETIKRSLLSLGVAVLENGFLAYPKSFTSEGYVDALSSYIKNKGVSLHLETKVLDYHKKENNWVLRTNHGEFAFEKLVFCSGGKSGRNLGSDGNLFEVFAKHGYSIGPLTPGLCPVKTKENVSTLDGIRHPAKVSIVDGDSTVYEEEGEVLFRKDGLSGIVVFNIERKLAHLKKDCLVLDLFPNQSFESLAKEAGALLNANSGFAPAFLPGKLFEYCLASSRAKNLKSNEDVYAFCHTLKTLPFHVSGFYDFASSQVTIGGISLENISCKNFESKLESNVYFLGEVLDIDGPCGGYNLEWCLVGALALSEIL